MTDARDRVLGAVRRGLAQASLPPAPLEEPTAGGAKADAGASVSAAMLCDRFAGALTALGGHVHLAAHPGEAATIVEAIVEQHGSSDFISWNAAEIPCPGLLEALAARGWRRLEYEVPFDQAERAETLARLASIGIGITGGLAAIAESGTIVLASGTGRGRLPSLLPPVHIAVLRARDVHPTLASVVAAHPRAAAERGNVVLITGPSRTADIEMTLTRGVHGPKHVHVVLVMV